MAQELGEVLCTICKHPLKFHYNPVAQMPRPCDFEVESEHFYPYEGYLCGCVALISIDETDPIHQPI